MNNITFNNLGYVGPDDLESFINVHKITFLLNKTHVLPYKIDLKERPANVFFIGTDQTGIRAKVKKCHSLFRIYYKYQYWLNCFVFIRPFLQC